MSNLAKGPKAGLSLREVEEKGNTGALPNNSDKALNVFAGPVRRMRTNCIVSSHAFSLSSLMVHFDFKLDMARDLS